jgi:hypothetical protein
MIQENADNITVKENATIDKKKKIGAINMYEGTKGKKNKRRMKRFANLYGQIEDAMEVSHKKTLMKSGYTEKQAYKIKQAGIDKHFGNSIYIKNIEEFRKGLLRKAENVLGEMLEIETSKDDAQHAQLLKIKQDTAKYIATGLSKGAYKGEENDVKNTFNKITINFINPDNQETIKVKNTETDNSQDNA